MKWTQGTRCARVQLVTAALVAIVALAGCGKGAASADATSPSTASPSTASPTTLGPSSLPPSSTPSWSPAESMPAVQLAPMTPTTSLPTLHVTELPRQGVATLLLIWQGGPFPYRQDGAVFQNRERILPRQPTGFYREYTVKKPGEGDRGPWRIVTGQDGSRFWTADHYESFQEVIE